MRGDLEGWSARIAAAARARERPLRAETFHRTIESMSCPALLTCEDSRAYVVKGSQVAKWNIADRVVATLGIAIGAPVFPPVLVDVPQELLDAEPALARVRAGIGHGTLFMDGVHDSYAPMYHEQPVNRPRYAALALLFGWTVADDSQYLFENADPFRVWSVDHGGFLANGPDWSLGNLESAPPPELDPDIVRICRLVEAEFSEVRAVLAAVSSDQIAAAVASPPTVWGIDEPRRIELAVFLQSRIQRLLGDQWLSSIA